VSHSLPMPLPSPVSHTSSSCAPHSVSSPTHQAKASSVRNKPIRIPKSKPKPLRHSTRDQASQYPFI
jgi:hypothetical protein